MLKQKKSIFALGILAVSTIQSFSYAPVTQAQIPNEYRPNYKFANEWQKVEEINTVIAAKQRNSQTIEAFYFRDLLKNYSVLFQYMPQGAQNKSIYENCRVLTTTLSKEFDPNTFTNYYNNCRAPLGEIFKEIAVNNTVKAKISAKPSNGSAPLTVTFDGRASSDTASNTTIPSKNFYWYYTDTNGVEQVIGNGPIVKHTFTKEGNYVVNLTVRSVNAMKEGVFDGSSSINIDVGPQAARLIVFANGRRLREDLAMKFTSQEAADGLKVDGTATAPLGGRQILKHQWQVINSENQILFQEGSVDPKTRNNGSPGSVKFPLSSNGLYSIVLKIQDNEGNVVENSFDVVISDPIATIRVTPANGNTSTKYTFDASTSYSVQSALKSYSWVITDIEGNEITKSSMKTLEHNFTQPGTYRVRLSVRDQQGNENEEVVTVQVDSTTPVPQFTQEATRQRLKPSEFTFDASPSYDVDTKYGDALTYEWSFSNNDNVSIEKTFDEGKRITALFREKGKYKVTLTVKDNYNKIASVSKDVDIQSTLRPKFVIRPQSVKLGENINFILKTNKAVQNYKVDFGDSKIENSVREQYSYRYRKVGMYVIKVTAYGDGGEENTISTNVFVGDADKPMPVYSVLNKQNELVIPEFQCTDPNGGTSPAYVVERYEDITIDGNESLSIQGAKSNLIHYFKPQIDDIFKGPQKRHRFDEIGCQFIDYTLEDTAANKTERTRIWFYVTNAKPKIANVVMTFPQITNNFGVGIGQNANQDQFKDDAVYPLLIKVEATNPKDSDGTIAKYKWYYYNIDNPQRLLEVKYTPGNTPYTYFTIDKVFGEYRFGVEIFDNDGESSNSEDILGKGPVIFVSPSSEETDIPIVTLKIDRTNAKVGEGVTLETIARTNSSRNDFGANAIYTYDLDGDGLWDQVTKDNKITWVYKIPGNYTPRVKVTYRGKSSTADGETVVVQKGVKASFLYGVIGDLVIVRDTSLGEIVSRKFCKDRRICNNEKAITENQTAFTITYDKPGTYFPKYEVKDKYGNTSLVIDEKIAVGAPLPADSVGIVTLPRADNSGTVPVGKNLDNKVLFYIAYNGKGDCYVDKDITKSSTGKERPDQDRDISCNVDTLIQYEPTIGSTIARVYHQIGDSMVTKDITIGFLDFEVDLSADQKEIYDQIDTILNQLGDNAPGMKSLLLQLRNTVVQGDNLSSLLLQVRDALENNFEPIPAGAQSAIVALLDSLENETTCSVNGCNDYKISRKSIINLFRSERKEDIGKLFEKFDNAPTPTDKKQVLEEILALGSDEQNNGHLEQADIDELNKEICTIVVYFDIPGMNCSSEDEILSGATTDLDPDNSGGSSIGWKILKVIGIIVGILGLAFLILVVIFALKAKKKQESGQQTS